MSWGQRVIAFLIAGLFVLGGAFWITYKVVGHGHPELFRGVWIGLSVLAFGAIGWGMYAYRGRRRTRVRLLSELWTLTPAAFEETIADLLFDLGYRKLELVGRAGDRGADIVGRDHRGLPIIVQCKRYAPGARAGSPDIQRFLGAITVHGLNGTGRGIFVTTSEFTAPAQELAHKHGVQLIDGPRLGVLLQRVQAGGPARRSRIPT